ncbi:MAG: TetR family transcriptional regulator [Gammaproteobacteria bacterium]|nr:MAG: TetR family transcriptional regulator [Gammaproteobacteria bacterium]
MGRRSDHTSEELRALVLQKTRALLDQVPASELSLRKIAKQVGYAPSTLIALFQNYNSLLLEVNGQTLDEIYLRSSHQLDTSLAPDQVLLALAYLYHDYAMDNPHQWELVFDHKMPVGEVVPETHQARMAAHFESIERQLQRIHADLAAIEINTTARTIWACVHGITVLSVKNKLFVADQLNGRSLIESFLVNFLRSWGDSHSR